VVTPGPRLATSKADAQSIQSHKFIARCDARQFGRTAIVNSAEYWTAVLVAERRAKPYGR